MKINDLEGFKRDLAYCSMKVITKTGDVIKGILVSKEIEKAILRDSLLPFPFKNQDFICLVLDGYNKASFIAVSDIKVITVE